MYHDKDWVFLSVIQDKLTSFAGIWDTGTWGNKVQTHMWNAGNYNAWYSRKLKWGRNTDFVGIVLS